MSTTKHTAASWPELTVLLVSLLVLAGVGYRGWQAAKAATESAAQQTATARSSPSPLPSLKLNNPHQRQGAIIQADPADLGKANPFQ